MNFCSYCPALGGITVRTFISIYSIACLIVYYVWFLLSCYPAASLNHPSATRITERSKRDTTLILKRSNLKPWWYFFLFSSTLASRVNGLWHQVIKEEDTAWDPHGSFTLIPAVQCREQRKKHRGKCSLPWWMTSSGLVRLQHWITSQQVYRAGGNKKHIWY